MDVTCNIDSCGKTFPEDLKEAHFNQEHLDDLKGKAMSKIAPKKKGEAKVNLIAGKDTQPSTKKKHNK